MSETVKTAWSAASRMVNAAQALEAEARLLRESAAELTRTLDPPLDQRPAECRERLVEEGKMHGRSNCAVCGSLIRAGWRCPHAK